MSGTFQAIGGNKGDAGARKVGLLPLMDHDGARHFAREPDIRRVGLAPDRDEPVSLGACPVDELRHTAAVRRPPMAGPAISKPSPSCWTKIGWPATGFPSGPRTVMVTVDALLPSALRKTGAAPISIASANPDGPA